MKGAEKVGHPFFDETNGLNLGPIMSEKEIQVAVEFGANEVELRAKNTALIEEFKQAMRNYNEEENE